MAAAQAIDPIDPGSWDFEVWAPAKVNLHLEVLGKRIDGFHEIETLMVPIDLYDTLYFREDRKGDVRFSFELTGRYRRLVVNEDENVPEGTDNLVVQAVELVRRRAGIRAGVQVRLVKRIPLAAGLAGGSSDAAASLIAANRLFDAGLGLAELRELAAQLGSDVPFFLGPGAAVATGRGEKLSPVGPLPRLHFVIVRPPEGLSTAQVYQACRPAGRPRRVTSLLNALVQGRLSEAGRQMFNRLEPAARSLSPWIDRLEREMNRFDCLGHQMSGSGTSYFALCRHARHARGIAAFLQGRGVGAVYAVASRRLTTSR